MKIFRRKSNLVKVGNVSIGSNSPIVVQSMTDTDTTDVVKTVNQIKELCDAGSEIVRITVNNDQAAKCVEIIKKNLIDDGYEIPLVGDFHFIGHRLLTNNKSCAEKLDKYRINPGNVGRGNKRDENFEMFIKVAVENNKPVRIGVNAGSLDSELLDLKMEINSKRKNPLSSELVENEALVESALISAEKAIDLGLPEDKIIISCKVSRVNQMISVYKELSEKCNFPLHLGLTEAGMGMKGISYTSVALGNLLYQGIGDTIRCSLTPEVNGDRTNEVKLCQEILQSIGVRDFNPTVTSCPGCGRTTSTFFRELSEEIQDFLNSKKKLWNKNYPGSASLKVAVMGCVVNGPGESKSADIGISLPGSGESPKAPVFVDGNKVDVLEGNEIAKQFINMIEDYVINKWGQK
ncbi:MAG: flavodoxin-dependent (E)-4-hydroxy-3-methylbut-2-enyl-diphosphate synthase [Chloroflexota bacterium]|nr:4-hydroxy-3-methylbut-2-en-1-yl diphosphate synthase [Chloroflexota bacterium]MEC8749882.1 flavodoxin-dependent (E)-4-hydroxy-3-methylbut-2-enyl-diphosphate synthase [Chloroflexota bacterium]